MPHPVDSQINNADLETLLGFAPAMVFVLIGGASGELDQKSKDTFVEALEELAQHPEKPIAEFGLNAFKHTGDALNAIQQKKLTADDSLRTAVHFLNTAEDQAHSQKIKRALYELGEAIAKSSGRGLLGLSDFRKPERQALAQLKTILSFS